MKKTANMKTALKFLGEPYTVKNIDFETCLYRDLLNGYDIEVSGVNRPQEGICNFVQVWDVREGPDCSARTVEKIYDIETLEKLKIVLDRLSEKYGGEQKLSERPSAKVKDLVK